MKQDLLFSSGLELANLVVSSGLLKLSWEKILELRAELNQQNEPIRWKLYHHQQPEFYSIAFITSPSSTKKLLQEEEFVPSSSIPLFQFLSTDRRNSSFNIHKAAVTLFDSIYAQLSSLKNRFGNSIPLIITGHSLGGSVASLFTLWLLESINRPGTKRPLCITFGAPLVGDKGLQEAVSQHLTWNSCFLHVAVNHDLVPRLFISPPHDPNAMEIDSRAVTYEPFGTFLLCSEFGCTCFEDPEAVSEVMVAVSSGIARTPNPNEPWHIVDYGKIVDHLMSIVIVKGTSEHGEFMGGSLRAGIVLQLEAIGVKTRQQTSDINVLIGKMEKWEKACVLKRKMVFDPSKKLNDMKINMTHLEWYKKDSKTDNKGYYDSYKNKGFLKKDMNVILYKKRLNAYWEKMVAQAEKMPQTEEASFRTRWLYAGTNYRRMVEPLDIADYYKDKGLTDYKTNGRSQHYKKLEQWLEEAGKPSSSTGDSKKHKVPASLTEDSCFWAHVEEALIQCKFTKNRVEVELATKNLMMFEKYVMEQINNYAVSPEIFLGGSSFMQWWKEYEEIIGSSCSSDLTNYMKEKSYSDYFKYA